MTENGIIDIIIDTNGLSGMCIRLTIEIMWFEGTKKLNSKELHLSTNYFLYLLMLQSYHLSSDDGEVSGGVCGERTKDAGLDASANSNNVLSSSANRILASSS